MIRELLPETVTLDGSENLFINSGINTLNATLSRRCGKDDVNRLNQWQEGERKIRIVSNNPVHREVETCSDYEEVYAF